MDDNARRILQMFLLFALFSSKPGACIVQKIIIAAVEHTIGTKVHQHHAGDMPDDQQSFGSVTAGKAVAGIILFMKKVAHLIVVFQVAFHGLSFSVAVDSSIPR